MSGASDGAAGGVERKAMSNIPLPGQVYRHFKGNFYQIITMARHSETGEELVIYQALSGACEVYAKPLFMFLERLDKEKYPDAAQEFSFELQKGPVADPAKQEDMGEPNAQKLNTGKEAAAIESEPSEKLNIDPLVLEFLDAGTYEERLNILVSLHHRITDEMINIMAIAVDVEIEEGDIEERFEQLRNCLLTFEKYESNRLR